MYSHSVFESFAEYHLSGVCFIIRTFHQMILAFVCHGHLLPDIYPVPVAKHGEYYCYSSGS